MPGRRPLLLWLLLPILSSLLHRSAGSCEGLQRTKEAFCPLVSALKFYNQCSAASRACMRLRTRGFASLAGRQLDPAFVYPKFYRPYTCGSLS